MKLRKTPARAKNIVDFKSGTDNRMGCPARPIVHELSVWALFYERRSKKKERKEEKRRLTFMYSYSYMPEKNIVGRATVNLGIVLGHNPRANSHQEVCLSDMGKKIVREIKLAT